MQALSKSKLVIDFQYASASIEAALTEQVSEALMKKWVKAATHQSGMLTLRFVNTSEGKKLNLAYRNKDKATNVLTFPYELSKTHLLADIIFCLPVVKKEAKEQGKTFKAHLAHLIIHGCLHAQAYDHENDKEAKKMESLEVQILKKLGFPNPYLDS
ncbi:rRNA maturation RNase YbeY [Polynucleobacter sp. AP-Latsch-80-C2]|jgi:probable rRNA maturation factor|uniref:rRNA maturation RNase YbeY n=1 Tax=Polynucleobacter sp. AP-Latsch-80-C2 TaxID=2576931 RepID=UPI001C0C8626|nr:rRNA maturation RNase YbeY [Polynucleobacter sp. AP-Latsch-80-C2]MBU3622913.1 rRNA maturation RNase YbeY [Polynucleobacter sp. AP-Latsch-80-C2]